MKQQLELEDLAPSADLRPLEGRNHRLNLVATTTSASDAASIDTDTADAAPSGTVGVSADATAPAGAGPAGAGRGVLPGLLLVMTAVGGAYLINRAVPAVSPLVASVAIGALATNLGLVPGWARAGIQFSAKKLLRLGVVLLGFQLAVGEVVRLGGPGILLVLVVVATTFFGTQWMGRKLGVSSSLSLLIATGFSICGASAVAAMEGVADAEEEEVAFSIALVTLCGSLAIFVLPLIGGPLGLEGSQFGSWVGASVHDIAQVVATASTGGAASLNTAVIVKLTRIVLLAPMVAGVTLARRRSKVLAGANSAGANSADANGAGVAVTTVKKPPIMPLFVAGFLAAIAIRSTGVVPTAWLPTMKLAETLTLAAALVGLGTGVHFAKLRKLGGRPLVLALGSWVMIATVSYVGVRLIGA